MRLTTFFSRHSEFIGQVATLMSGKTIAAAIALFTTPIVARLFEPSDFGVAAVFVSIISIVSNISSLRYEATLSLPKSEDEARTLMALCYWILLAVCLGMLILVGTFRIGGISVTTLELLGPWSWLLPFGVLLMGSLHVQECWLTRKKLFKISSVSLVTGNAVTSGSRISFGALFGTSAYGLIVGYLLGTLVRLIVQRSASKEALQVSFRDVDWPAMRRTARDYADFPKLNAPAGLLFALGGNLPILLFGGMFSPAVAGLYAMAHQLARVPTGIVATSLRRVFLRKAAAIVNRGGSLRKAFLLATGGLALLGLVPLVVLSLFGQPLLGWLLGARWLEAGRYLEIIAPWMFIIWVTAPANPVFVVLRRQKFWLVLQSTITVLRLAIFGVAYLIAAGPVWTLRAYVTVTVVYNTVTILIALALTSRHAAKPVVDLDESGGGKTFDDDQLAD
jgi:O-antigen/teichoic acid export membrane protein